MSDTHAQAPGSSPVWPGAGDVWEPPVEDADRDLEQPRDQDVPTSPGGLLVTALCFVVAGAVGGLLWNWVWSPAQYVVSDGRGSLGEVGLADHFSSDGWYAVVALVLAAVVATVRRRTSAASGVFDLLVALVASVAAAYLMLGVGELVGPSTPEAGMRGLADGVRVDEALGLGSSLATTGWASHVYVVLLAWPVGAMFGWFQELLWPRLEPDASSSASSQGAGPGAPADPA